MTQYNYPALQGPCRDADPDLFFDQTAAGVEDAKAVCRRCPVAVRCLTWALETGQEHGTWGGMSEDERENLRRPAMRRAS